MPHCLCSSDGTLIPGGLDKDKIPQGYLPFLLFKKSFINYITSLAFKLLDSTFLLVKADHYWGVTIVVNKEKIYIGFESSFDGHKSCLKPLVLNI